MSPYNQGYIIYDINNILIGKYESTQLCVDSLKLLNIKVSKSSL